MKLELKENMHVRTKDERLIKDYYLPAQLSKKLIEILKGEYNVK